MGKSLIAVLAAMIAYVGAERVALAIHCSDQVLEWPIINAYAALPWEQEVILIYSVDVHSGSPDFRARRHVRGKGAVEDVAVPLSFESSTLEPENGKRIYPTASGPAGHLLVVARTRRIFALGHESLSPRVHDSDSPVLDIAAHADGWIVLVETSPTTSAYRLLDADLTPKGEDVPLSTARPMLLPSDSATWIVWNENENVMGLSVDPMGGGQPVVLIPDGHANEGRWAGGRSHALLLGIVKGSPYSHYLLDANGITPTNEPVPFNVLPESGWYLVPTESGWAYILSGSELIEKRDPRALHYDAGGHIDVVEDLPIGASLEDVFVTATARGGALVTWGTTSLERDWRFVRKVPQSGPDEQVVEAIHSLPDDCGLCSCRAAGAVHGDTGNVYGMISVLAGGALAARLRGRNRAWRVLPRGARESVTGSKSAPNPRCSSRLES
jgi:hypothetical protein